MGVFVLIFGGEMSGLGSLMLVTAVMFWVYKYVLKKMAVRFQNGLLVRMEGAYERSLRFALKGKVPYLLVGGTVLLLVVARWPLRFYRKRTYQEVNFFPDNKPNQIIVYIEYPQGTDIEKTNLITKDIGKKGVRGIK